jgi:hypothetical protein
VRGRISIHRESCRGPRGGDQLCPGVPLERLSPNGWRLSGDGGEADGVRCSRGLGGIRFFV